MKPLIPYYGSKERLAPWIVSLLPPHRVYVEPFFGAGAVLFAKPPSPQEIVNDLDRNVVTFFRVLRERPAELERVCRLTPYARDEHAAADLTDPDLDDLERARRFWVRVTQGFNACTTTGSWAHSATTGPNQPVRTLNRLQRLEAAAARLAPVLVERAGALDVIAKYATTPDTVVYADPPYLIGTRRRGDRQRGNDYALDTSTEADHRALAAQLHATPATVLLSGYPSALYDDLYGDWHRVEQTVTRSTSNRTGRMGTPGTEVIWSNRALVTQGALDLAWVGA